MTAFALRTALLSPIADSVRSLLSGEPDGSSAVVRRIATPAGAPGWFVPDDPIWTVHGSVATFVGGIRALYLQSLHPAALAGVNQHSTYREDPIGRLQRTGAFLAATTFGSQELAERTTRAVRALHRPVVGETRDGTRYSAQDPRLLLWVHIGLVDSMLVAYEVYGRDGTIDADRYVANMAKVGESLGMIDPPRTVAELQRAIESFHNEVAGGPEVQSMRRFIGNPPLPIPLRPGYAVLAAAARDSLPPWAQQLIEDRRPKRLAVLLRHRTAELMLRTLRLALGDSPARLAGEERLGLAGLKSASASAPGRVESALEQAATA